MKWLMAIFLALCGCYSDNGPWVYNKEGDYGPKHWHSKLRPSDSAPESLKPYFDPELTEKLNERTYTVYPTWEKWLIDPLHYDSSVW